MESKKVFITITITLCLVISLLGFYVYRQYSEIRALTIEHVRLQAEYAALQKEYGSLEERHVSLESSYEKLQVNYTSLEKEYGTLKIEYSTLSDQFARLGSDYASLSAEKSDLNERYERLFSDYQQLLQFKEMYFDKPLEERVFPSTESLRRWLLYEDETDTVKYDDPDFVCGDFAVMLSMHARVKHWDMGVVAIWGYREDTREELAHAFNVLVTTDGLVYIEPQNDDIWWYENHEKISAGKTYEYPPLGISLYIKDVEIILRY